MRHENAGMCAPVDNTPLPRRSGLRLALLSTPRSGNNWLRHLLSSLYGVAVGGVHCPDDLDWDNLPEDLAFGIHWRRTADLERRLHDHRFRAVVLARHPLDVLISVLQFCWRSPTARWLEGEMGDERALFGAMPRSTAFLEYATGPRAAALLAVSREWWQAPGCLPVRYEDLVHAPHATLGRLAEAVGQPTRRPIEEALRATAIPALRARTRCAHHFWQGKPGLWKSLLTAPEARQIAAAHPAVFAELGYELDVLADVTPSEADANWINLVGENLVSDLRALEPARKELGDAQARLASAEQTAVANILEGSEKLRSLQAVLDAARFESAQQLRRLRDLADAAALESAETIGNLQASLEAARQVAAEASVRLAQWRTAADDAQWLQWETEEALEETSDELARVKGRLAELEGLGATVLGIARRLHLVSMKYPRMFGLVVHALRVGRRAALAVKAVCIPRALSSALPSEAPGAFLPARHGPEWGLAPSPALSNMKQANTPTACAG